MLFIALILIFLDSLELSIPLKIAAFTFGVRIYLNEMILRKHHDIESTSLLIVLYGWKFNFLIILMVAD